MTRQLKENLATGARWIVSKRYGGNLHDMLQYMSMKEVTQSNYPHRTVTVSEQRAA